MDVKVGGLWNRCRSQISTFYRSLTRPFDYSLDQFFGLDFLMVAGGVRFSSRNVKFRRFWNIYRWFIQVPLILVFWNTIRNVREQENLEIILSCLQALVCGFTVNIKMILMLCQFDALVQVRKFLNKRYFGRNLERAWNIRCESFYRIRKSVIVCIAAILSIFGVYFTVDLANNHALKFPFDLPLKHPNITRVLEPIVALALCGLAMKILLLGLVIPVILNGLTSEMKVIALMFSETLKNSEIRAEWHVEQNPGNSRHNETNFRKNLQEELNECIELHVKFFGALVKIRPLLNATFLVLYYSTALNLACGTIYVTQMKSVSVFALQTLFYCIWVAFECNFVTKMVDELADVCESISFEIYDLDWPTKLQFDNRFHEQYRSVRKTMVTLMAVAQQPLRLNCFGLFEFNQERFNELLKMTYSLYAFLRDFA